MAIERQLTLIRSWVQDYSTDAREILGRWGEAMGV